MSTTQAVAQPEAQAAHATVAEGAVATPPAALENTSAAAVDAARQEVQPPEQHAVVPETALDTSIAPKDRPPIIKPETSEAESAAPSTLASIAAILEANAAKQAGELIAQANIHGANIPIEGLALTVKIDKSPTAAQPSSTPEKGQEAPAIVENAAVSSPALTTPAIEQPAVSEVKPEGLLAAPVTQVVTPAEHQGIAANKDKLAIGA